jgi:CBS domain containing-hemolysin-like protein
MVPRTEIVAIEINTSLDALKEKFIETSLSRILVYKDNIDNIIGFIHHSDLFQQPERLHEVLHPIIIVSENLDAHDLLKRFINERKSMAVIVDEFGGTAGIATVEDVIEEIFGEIKDEFDTEDAQEQKLGDRHYRLDARLEIDYLNEKYEFNLAEGEYNTLGGYIIFFAQRIPQVGDSIRHDQFEFLIKKMKGARIEEVEMKIY